MIHAQLLDAGDTPISAHQYYANHSVASAVEDLCSSHISSISTNTEPFVPNEDEIQVTCAPLFKE